GTDGDVDALGQAVEAVRSDVRPAFIVDEFEKDWRIRGIGCVGCGKELLVPEDEPPAGRLAKDSQRSGSGDGGADLKGSRGRARRQGRRKGRLRTRRRASPSTGGRGEHLE